MKTSNNSSLFESRSLGTIAREIEQDWKKVHFSARPYLDAMHSLDKITDKYGLDSGKSIVAYFLSNAASWRGPKAKEIKKELNKMLKEQREYTSEDVDRVSKKIRASAKNLSEARTLAEEIGYTPRETPPIDKMVLESMGEIRDRAGINPRFVFNK